jgi:tetratricopeptide (TPR) repeat protein
MKPSQAKVAPPEPIRFLNRKKQLRHALGHISALIQDSTRFHVLEVIGPGGAGKTRLLQELRDSAKELASSPARVIWVPLEAERVSAGAGPLLLIRNQLEFDCLLYDTALLSYWNATGQPLRLELSNPLARSLPVQFLQTGAGAAGFPLPLSFGLEAFAYWRKKRVELRLYQPEEFEAIDLLRDTPERILSTLPEYLAIDIARALDPTEELIAFYDGYEKQKAKTLTARAPWLRMFLQALHSGVHVISTREPMGWDGAEWDDPLEELPVGPLPDPQSRELIRARLGTVDEAVVERVLETSRRLPFFLETVVGGTPQTAGESIQVDDLPSPTDDPVGHLLTHLDESQQKLATALAAVQVFDRELFECIVRELFLNVDFLGFDDFVDRFYVEAVPPTLHKTHDILTQFVREFASADPTAQRALRAASESLPGRCQRNPITDTNALLSIFAAVVSGWYSIAEPPPVAVESLVDAGYLLYDAGYWAELGSLPLGGENRSEHPVSVAAEFFAALSARRTVGVDRARELFEKLEGRVSVLGRHRESVELETAYLKELAGDYPSARSDFVDLEGRIDQFDATSRIHVRSRLYLADMQIMDGDLEDGARLLLDTYEADRLSRLDWAELVRHRGHAFRFSFLFETAVELYLKAMRAATGLGLPALQAKLWTNLAEAQCWSAPALALEAAANSAELNRRIGNRIELAKCEAARAIALAKLGRSDEATEAVAEAHGHADRIGYPAGNTFALQAAAISFGLAEDSGVGPALEALEQSLASLGTYAHLAVAPMCLGVSDGEFGRAVGRFKWQEPNLVEERIRQHLGR